MEFNIYMISFICLFICLLRTYCVRMSKSVENFYNSLLELIGDKQRTHLEK